MKYYSVEHLQAAARECSTLKLVTAILYQIFIFHPMIALQKL